MKIVWDEPKRLENLISHRLDFVDCDRFAWDTSPVKPSYPGRRGERRYAITGYLDADLVTIVFAPLGSEAVSIISMRRASRKERRIYDET